MKTLTKYLIAAATAIGAALQFDGVQQYIAAVLIPIVSSHPKFSAALGAISTILLLIHNPKSSPATPEQKQGESFNMKKLGSGVLIFMLAASMTISGCSFSTAVSDVAKYLPTAIQSFGAILSILQGAGIVKVGTATMLDNDANVVSAGFGDVQAAVNAYNQAPKDSKASALQKVTTALMAVEGQIGKFEADVRLPDSKLQNLVNGLLGVLIAGLTGVEANLAGPVALKAYKASKVRVTSVGDYKKQFNTLLAGGGFAQYALR